LTIKEGEMERREIFERANVRDNRLVKATRVLPVRVHPMVMRSFLAIDLILNWQFGSS
jgi:hypothetical protein